MLGAGREQLSGEATSMKSDSKEQDLIHEEFTYIYGAPTQILKCGPWEDLWNDKSAPRLLFLVIPGNPGLVGFYQTFVKALYCGLNQQYPVWVVSHGGHCKIPYGVKRKEALIFSSKNMDWNSFLSFFKHCSTEEVVSQFTEMSNTFVEFQFIFLTPSLRNNYVEYLKNSELEI